MFLAFWLPLNNGLRPEPIIALGILLTWCSVERGVATSRLLPVAIAHHHRRADAVLRADRHRRRSARCWSPIGPLKTIVRRRILRGSATWRCWRRSWPRAPSPIILIFRDQTLAGEMQASTFKSRGRARA